MEDEKNKKKRNKKKKNNNNVQVRAMDEVSEDQSQASSEVKDVENHRKESDDVCPSGNLSNGSDSTILVESEKQQWLQKEAILEETIRQLQAEKDTHIQKEATLLHTVSQLNQVNNLHSQKELTFEETIKQLRDENNSYIQKEATFEMKIGQLEKEKYSWIHKESQLEGRISQLLDEKIDWSLKEESLEDRVRHLESEKGSLILKEDSNRVMIGNLSDEIAGLRAQVVELEETRSNILNENRQLMENIISLELRIKDIQDIASTQSSPELTKLASERDELNSQIEAAIGLVSRLMEENAELVEKVSELLLQLDRHGGLDTRVSTVPQLTIGTVETASFSHLGSKTNENMPEIGHKSNSIEIVQSKELRNGVHDTSNYHMDDVLPAALIPEESGEIVQIPLNENNVSDLESQVAEISENEPTPFTDAPLIGAPFRLISFVSRYVSGADLVEKHNLQV